jgi:transcriptional regulator with XRE-family HTH domain
MSFGEKLKSRREEKGLSQDDVADFLEKVLVGRQYPNGNVTRDIRR